MWRKLHVRKLHTKTLTLKVKVLLLNGYSPPQAIVFPVGGSPVIDQSAIFLKHIQYTAFPVLVKTVEFIHHLPAPVIVVTGSLAR